MRPLYTFSHKLHEKESQFALILNWWFQFKINFTILTEGFGYTSTLIFKDAINNSLPLLNLIPVTLSIKCTSMHSVNCAFSPLSPTNVNENRTLFNAELKCYPFVKLRNTKELPMNANESIT